jgi:hypothetical protein
VQVDNSQANGIASGTVLSSDPAKAEVAVTNNYHFWAAVDLQPATGTVNLRMAGILQDGGGLWAGGGLIPGGARAVWQGTFDAAQGSSQAAFVHFDLATAGGSAALAGTVLSIVADTFGDTIMLGSPEALQLAVNGITQGSDWQKLVEVMQKPAEHPNPLEAVPALMDLLGTKAGSSQMSKSLAQLGVNVSPQQVQGLGTLYNLLGFAQTLRDLVWAGFQGHTSGLVTFYTPGAPGSAGTSGTTTTVAPATTTELATTTTLTPGTTTTALLGTPPPTLTVGGAAVNGNIAYQDEADWYTFTVETAGSYTVETDAGTLTDTYLELYGPNSQTNYLDYSDNPAGTHMARLTRNLDPGTYYVKITGPGGYGSLTGTYSIKMWFNPIIDLRVGEPSASGNIAYQDEADWYTFTVETAGSYTVETDAGTLTDTYLELYGPAD